LWQELEVPKLMGGKACRILFKDRGSLVADWTIKFGKTALVLQVRAVGLNEVSWSVSDDSGNPNVTRVVAAEAKSRVPIHALSLGVPTRTRVLTTILAITDGAVNRLADERGRTVRGLSTGSNLKVGRVARVKGWRGTRSHGRRRIR
jgi:hypothetical protein